MEINEILDIAVKIATVLGGISALAAVCIARKSLKDINESIINISLNIGKVDNVNIFPKLQDKEIQNMYTAGRN
ncbi:MAG: hypothetical protein HOK52_13845 [Candidatus Marinimicrobia bacterium]|jgi:hypothetical protein|nr:hypothetical protein [Candidatus Neomarinimicrobiota bacterium]